MSTAYKHLYSCITFLIFLFVINFYKNRVGVGRDREASFRAATKLKRSGALNRPLPLDDAGEDFFFGFSSLGREAGNGFDVRADTADGWQWDRLKQYPGRCLDVEVFFLPRPPLTSFVGNSVGKGRTGARDPEGLHYKTLLQAGKRKAEQGDQQPSDESNSSIYVFLSVLVILLLAASVDIVKHLTAARSPKEPTQRRLSIQNYQALIREKQKQFRMMKQHCSQPSMSIQRSMDEPTGYPPTSLSSFPYGRVGEDTAGGVQQQGASARGLPAPLLRRQSVPTLMRSPPVGQHSAGGILMGGRNGGGGGGPPGGPAPFGRRTSVDSFWDADAHLGKPLGGACSTQASGSPQEVRRRVRMLHRH